MIEHIYNIVFDIVKRIEIERLVFYGYNITETGEETDFIDWIEEPEDKIKVSMQEIYESIHQLYDVLYSKNIEKELEENRKLGKEKFDSYCTLFINKLQPVYKENFRIIELDGWVRYERVDNPEVEGETIEQPLKLEESILTYTRHTFYNQSNDDIKINSLDLVIFFTAILQELLSIVYQKWRQFSSINPDEVSVGIIATPYINNPVIKLNEKQAIKETKKVKEILTVKQQLILLEQLITVLQTKKVIYFDFLHDLTKDQKGLLLGALLNRGTHNIANNLSSGTSSGKSDRYKIPTDKNIEAVNKLLDDLKLKDFKI